MRLVVSWPKMESRCSDRGRLLPLSENALLFEGNPATLLNALKMHSKNTLNFIRHNRKRSSTTIFAHKNTGFCILRIVFLKKKFIK